MKLRRIFTPRTDLGPPLRQKSLCDSSTTNKQAPWTVQAAHRRSRKVTSRREIFLLLTTGEGVRIEISPGEASSRGCRSRQIVRAPGRQIWQ
jgi:hypothetical protein